jgi:hypothetical protein
MPGDNNIPSIQDGRAVVAGGELDAEKVRSEARRILQAVDCLEEQHKKPQSTYGAGWLSLFSIFEQED